MDTNRLVIICPDCHFEPTVLNYFRGTALCLTTLGAVFDSSDVSFIEEVKYAVTAYGLREIDVVMVSDCRFVKEAMNDQPDIDHKVVKLLKTRLNEYRSKEELSVAYLVEQALRQQLAKLNALPSIARLVNESKLCVRGFVYVRESGMFKEVNEIHPRIEQINVTSCTGRQPPTSR